MKVISFNLSSSNRSKVNDEAGIAFLPLGINIRSPSSSHAFRVKIFSFDIFKDKRWQWYTDR